MAVDLLSTCLLNLNVSLFFTQFQVLFYCVYCLFLFIFSIENENKSSITCFAISARNYMLESYTAVVLTGTSIHMYLDYELEESLQ